MEGIATTAVMPFEFFGIFRARFEKAYTIEGLTEAAEEIAVVVSASAAAVAALSRGPRDHCQF